MPMQGSFDATTMGPPRQLTGDKHPIGNKFPFQITNTEIKPTKNSDGGMFVVEFTTPAGIIFFRYNLWNKNETAVKIAHDQLNLLCHVTGIYKLDWSNDAAVLRGARGMLDVGWQKGQEPTTENPDGGYTEIKKMYDANGNEPSKAPASAPQPQQPAAGAPLMPQANGGWAPQGIAAQPAPAANSGGWQGQPQQPAANPPQGWQQNSAPAANNPPPWAK